MKKQNRLFLTLALGVSSGTLLVDRFLVTIPDWLVIILIIIAIVLLVYHLIISIKK